MIPRVLLADDDEAVREMLQVALERDGFEVANTYLASELQTKLDMTYWTGLLPCGHEIAPVQAGSWYFDRPQRGRLWGYNPMDPRWVVLQRQLKK